MLVLTGSAGQKNEFPLYAYGKQFLLWNNWNSAVLLEKCVRLNTASSCFCTNHSIDFSKFKTLTLELSEGRCWLYLGSTLSNLDYASVICVADGTEIISITVDISSYNEMTFVTLQGKSYSGQPKIHSVVLS